MVAIFDFIKSTQGWQFHTHMDIIYGGVECECPVYKNFIK